MEDISGPKDADDEGGKTGVSEADGDDPADEGETTEATKAFGGFASVLIHGHMLNDAGIHEDVTQEIGEDEEGGEDEEINGRFAAEASFPEHVLDEVGEDGQGDGETEGVRQLTGGGGDGESTDAGEEDGPTAGAQECWH